jgi:dihydrofolate reductase
MSHVTCQISMSLHGYVAGPNQCIDNPIAGVASAVRQYLAAGLLDQLHLHIVPIVLGTGERLLVDVGDPTLEPVEVVASPAVTHVKYRVVR